MKKTIKTKAIAAVLAAVCAVSAVTTAAIVSASAASVSTSQSQTSKSVMIIAKTYDNTFVMPMKGEDWTYFADSLNVKVTCDYDYKNNMCNFKFTALKAGVVNVVLKTQNTDGKWTNTPVRITADSNLLMTIVQTDNAYITEKSYTETPAKTTSSETKKTETETKKTETPAAKGTVIVTNAGNPFTLPIRGNDWTYTADSLNVKIGCDFDYKNNVCKFKFTAVKPGVTNAILRTEREDGKWNNIPVTITADNGLKITVVQTANAYITNTKRG